MRWPSIIIFAIWVIGCSEPFEFDANGVEIHVIDGKVSTLEGRSFIRIYSLKNENIVQLSDLDVRVVSNAGTEYSFNYVSDSSVYVPNQMEFMGVEGISYKLQVYRNSELIYESDYDSIAPAIDFTITTADTTVSTFSSGVIINENGKVVLANIASSRDINGKFEFRYFYQDYFTEETIEVNDEEEYTLYSCDPSEVCPDSIGVAVGLTLREEWYFFKNTALCNTVRDTADFLRFVQNCEQYFNCCHVEEEWLAEFEVISESISPEIYGFWSDVEKLGSNDGLVFDTYPFPLRGNVRSANGEVEVVGIFRAVSEVSKTKPVFL
ncbi:hypothetical protein [Ekhidna sp.]|uniref:hypothetical protein n=1 Tax=Ekhidna sp. TaxID=2608089 RepID=UPI003CCBA19F